MKILVSDGIEESGAMILAEAGHELVQKKLAPEELLNKISEYDAIIVRSATKVTRDVIDAGKRLKVIARGGVGLDNIDVEHAKSKGIPVLNTPGASSISVAELTIAHMLAVGRFLHQSNIAMREKAWPKKDYSKGIEVTGKTLGLLGIGNIGKEVAKRAIGLSMHVIAHDPFITSVDLDVELVSKDDVLKRADYISLHMPYKKSDPPAIGKEEFAKMKDGVIILNCARGGVVSEAGLLDALNSGKVAFAGIDVYENEPPVEAEYTLVSHPRVSVTPHIGASTIEAQNRVGIEIATKVVEALAKA